MNINMELADEDAMHRKAYQSSDFNFSINLVLKEKITQRNEYKYFSFLIHSLRIVMSQQKCIHSK